MQIMCVNSTSCKWSASLSIGVLCALLCVLPWPVCSDYIPPGGCDSTRSQTTSVLLVQVISDLLKPDKVNLMIREDRRRGVFVDGLSEWVVRSPAEVYGLMMRGAQQVGTSSRMTAWKAALCSCCMQVLCWCCSVLVLAMRLEAD